MNAKIVFKIWLNAEDVDKKGVVYVSKLNNRLKKCQNLEVERILACQKNRM